MEKLFYLQDTRSTVGNNVVFWNLDGNGYGTNLDKLETYTIENAQDYHDKRGSDVPLLKDLVDKLSIVAVDMQVLPDADTVDPNNEYVIQQNGMWNGNDIQFSATIGYTYDYSKAKIFSEKEIALVDLTGHTLFSKSALDKVSRRTFQQDNIDRKLMCKKAGIKLKKPKRVRPTTGKTRGNCPECGKITWDFNPYENAYCSSGLCD